MKKILFFLLICSTSLAQNQELVDIVTKTSYENKSYVYTRGVTLSPPSGGGSFRVTASEHGTFFVRPADGARIPKNTPPSPNKNFARIETILVPGITNEDQIPYLSVLSQVAVEYQYVDGLGRPWQNVSQRNSPAGYDITKFFAYQTNTGRVVNEYLPYVSGGTNGSFKDNYASDQLNFYGPSSAIAHDTRPYTEVTYEASPLDRVIKSFSAGSDWTTNNKFSSSSFKVDMTSTKLFWQYNSETVPPTLVQHANPNDVDGYYLPGMLTITESLDEEGKTVRSYTNFFGQTILNEEQDPNGVWLQTYSIYNPQGNLCIVLPPEASASITTYLNASNDAARQEFLDRLAFQYVYDKYGRVIKQKVPGAGWVHLVYDKWDRLVLSQDAVQRDANQWTFNKYDRFNRVVINGIYTTSTAHSVLQTDMMTLADANHHESEASNSIGYTLTSSFPTSGISESNINIINYYDNYDFLGYLGWAEANSYGYSNVPGYPQESEKLSKVKGYQTGSKVRVLGGDTKFLNSVTYYYKDYLPVQVIEEADLGGFTRVTKRFDFLGRVEGTHNYNSYTGISEEYTYTYDLAGRPLQTRHSINGTSPIILSANRYNELGQLIEKNLHSSDGGSSYLQSVDFQYNIRGWLSSINNSGLTAQAGDNNVDLFGMEIQYNPTSASSINGSFTTKKYYDGKVSAIKWKTNTLQPTIPPQERIYGLDYDALNRIKRAYSAANNSGVWTGDGGMFDEEVSEYDKHGNIIKLKRYGKVQNAQTLIDNLTYDYIKDSKRTDQLVNLEDATGNKLGFSPASASDPEEYAYDDNGNLKRDHNKSISSITYNHLNLPTMVQFTRSNGQLDRIYYTYDALGNKLSRRVNINGTDVWTTAYIKHYQYDKKENGSFRLSFFLQPEGKVINNGSAYDYEYFINDYLGNARIGFGALKETANYSATIEPELTTQEESDQGFKNISSRRSSLALHRNHTASSEQTPVPDYSAMCNGANGTSVGPAKSLRVLQGDAVYMEVYARYDVTTGSTGTVGNTALISALTGVTTFNIPNVGETAPLWSGFNSQAPAAVASIPASATVPKAYLVWLFFDDAYNFIRFGTKPVTNQAFNKFEKLDLSFTATGNGHLYMYVANESSANVNVFFDDFSITHQKNNATLQVTQATDYYPFGLAFNQYQSDRLYTVSTDVANPQNNVYTTALRNRYLFHGQELQKDLDLDWYQYEARMYDPALARWISVDPLAAEQIRQSPYSFVWNNPIQLIDPDGRYPYPGNFYVQPGLLENIYNRTVPTIGRHYANQVGAGPQTSMDLMRQSWFDQWSYDRMAEVSHWAGKQASNQTGGPYASGRHGKFLQVMSHIGGAIPGMGLPIGLVEARKGNYGSAALNLASGVTEFGAFSNSLRTIQKINKAVPDIQHLALGLNKTPYGTLNDFAQAVGGKTYREFTSGGLKPNEILEAIQNPNNALHFNLSGFSTRGALQKGSLGPYEIHNVTNWEYFQIHSTPGALQRTTFYRFEGGIYVPTPHTPKW